MDETPHFCSKCGEGLRPTARFCPKCGTPAKPAAQMPPGLASSAAQAASLAESPAIPPTQIVPESPPPAPRLEEAPRAAQPVAVSQPARSRRRTWLFVFLGVGALVLICCVIGGLFVASSGLLEPERAATLPATTKTALASKPSATTQAGAPQKTPQAAVVLPATDDG